MKAIIFIKQDRYLKYRWFLHIDQIKQISTNEFYSAYNVTHIKTEDIFFIINDWDKDDFYQRILDFIDDDKSYQEIKIKRVTEEDGQLEFSIEDWVSQAIGES